MTPRLKPSARQVAAPGAHQDAGAGEGRADLAAGDRPRARGHAQGALRGRRGAAHAGGARSRVTWCETQTTGSRMLLAMLAPLGCVWILKFPSRGWVVGTRTKIHGFNWKIRENSWIFMDGLHTSEHAKKRLVVGNADNRLQNAAGGPPQAGRWNAPYTLQPTQKLEAILANPTIRHFVILDHPLYFAL